MYISRIVELLHIRLLNAVESSPFFSFLDTSCLPILSLGYKTCIVINFIHFLFICLISFLVHVNKNPEYFSTGVDSSGDISISELRFEKFSRSLARSRYLSPISLSFNFTLWSAGTAKSTIQQVLFWGGYH